MKKQATGARYIPTHEFKENILAYDDGYVKIINEKITATSRAFKNFNRMNVL